MNKTKEKYFNSERLARRLPAILLAATIPFMIFIVSPLEIYSNGISEFSFSVFDFIWVEVFLFFIFTAIFFSLLFFTPKVVFRALYALGLAFLLLLFLQVNFLNAGLNSLAGDEVGGTNVSTGTLILNTVIWVVVLGGSVAGFFLFKKRDVKALICIMLSFALLASQFINFIVITTSTKDAHLTPYERLKQEDENYVPTFLTTKDMTTLSKEHNVIIFLVDRFDGLEYCEPAMKKHPEIFNKLDGFTYYSDCISMYARTYPSVCYMLNNIEMSVDSRKDYLIDAYKENETLSVLNDKNYLINLYTDPYYSYYNAFYLPDYINNKETTTFEKVNSAVDFEDKLILGVRIWQIAMYRSMPYILKDFFGNVSSDTCNDLVKMSAEDLSYPECSTDMKEVYDTVTKNDFTLTDKNVFSFIHLSGCHSVPYTEEWKKTNYLFDSTGDVNVSIKNSFSIITEYIKQMKKLGVYKDATIIITGDHANPGDNFIELNASKITATFVKKAGDISGNPISNKSDKPVSHADLWNTIFESENIAKSFEGEYSMFGEVPSDRTRHYYWDAWNISQTGYTKYKYEINGAGNHFGNWKKVGSPEYVSHNYYG